MGSSQAAEDELERDLQSLSDNFEQVFTSVEKNLSKKWIEKYKKAPSKSDVLWGVAGHLNLDAIKRQDFNTSGRVHFAQALYIHQIGKDCHYLLRACNRDELLGLRLNGVQKVTILSSKGCGSCRKISGKKLSIKEALKHEPLPCPGCSFKLNEAAPTGWCRCTYQADLNVLDFSDVSIWSN